jgi:hypothetical protein
LVVANIGLAQETKLWFKAFTSAILANSVSITAPALVTFVVSVASAPFSTFIAESNPDLVTDQVNHTTDCTASV